MFAVACRIGHLSIRQSKKYHFSLANPETANYISLGYPDISAILTLITLAASRSTSHNSIREF
jgi:hypothetical protein